MKERRKKLEKSLSDHFNAANSDTATPEDIIEVTAYALNLRTGPGTQYSIVKTLSKGSRWFIYGSSGSWLKLGTDKWVHGGYTKPSCFTKVVATTAKSGLNVRHGPGTSYSIIRVLPLNSKAGVLGESSGWYKIGNDEWISGNYSKPLDNTKYEWYYIPNSTHTVPTVNTDIKIAEYGGYYAGDTSRKVIYLTFDLGYEGGYTGSILDTLKKNNVKAAFFVTKSFIDEEPDLVHRMVNEGHIVGNHTKTHPSLPSAATNIPDFNNEINSVAAAYRKIVGMDMIKVMRPPMGDYSELSMFLTQWLGYKSFFWSFAYYDYDTGNQPDETYAFNKITGGTHNGAIMLLHGVSMTNAKILDSVIKDIRQQGYEFDTIDKL